MKIFLVKPLILTILMAASLNSFSQSKRDYYLLIGTYTKTQDKGIFVYKFDTQTGESSFQSSTEGIKNPSFLTINKNATKVYSVSQGAEAQLSSFDFDGKSGKLTFINSQETKSPGPCHVNLTADNKFLI